MKELLEMRLKGAYANANEAMGYIQNAKKAKELGDHAECTFYVTQAKQELANFDMNHKAVEDMVAKMNMKTDATTGMSTPVKCDCVHSMCWSMIKTYFTDWVTHLKKEVSEMT